MKTIVKQQENKMPLLNHPFIQVNHDENARDEFVLGLKRHINLNFVYTQTHTHTQASKYSILKRECVSGRDKLIEILCCIL